MELLVSPSPLLIWGLLSRGIGVVFLIAFGSLTFQVLPIAGSTGLSPIRSTMAAMRRDFGIRAPLYFPSVLWLDYSDNALLWVTRLGLLSSLAAIVGGALSPLALAACYILYLSLDRAVGLVYPWDSLLCEAGFWAMFLPATESLPGLQASGAPAPELCWVFRLMLFRVMFGFGKQKFLGSTRQDRGFLHGFYIRQPLPTGLGLWVHRLPMWVHRVCLLLMFVIEVPLPFGIFFPGFPTLLFAGATVALMVAIQAVGNFGFFNLLTIVLCLASLDTGTARALDLSGWGDASLPLSAHVLHGAFVLHLLVVLVSLPFNTWCSFTWTLWPLWRQIGLPWLTFPIRLVRLLQPFRWVHAYGVFSPRSVPAVRLAPVLEVAWHEEPFTPLRYRHYPSTTHCRPHRIAPHHPRLDQAIVYESVGFNEVGVLRNLSGRWDPYGYRPFTAGQALARQLMRTTDHARLWFGDSFPLEKGTPTRARARLYMLTLASAAARAREGRIWERTLLGSHFSEMHAGQEFPAEGPPPPELWHVDDVVWLQRSRFGRLLKQAGRGVDPHTLVCQDADDMTPELVAAFWERLVPSLCLDVDQTFRDVPQQVAELRARFDSATLFRFERLAGRYSALLRARAEPLTTAGGLLTVLGLREATLPVGNHQRLGLLSLYAVALGREHYDAAYAEPRRLIETLKHMTLARGMLLSILFRYETWLYQSRKFRLLESQAAQVGRTQKPSRLRDYARQVAFRAFGTFEMIDFLRQAFQHPAHVVDVEDRFPRFELREDLRFRLVEAPAAIDPTSTD